ncbi:hypothetical protein [Actinophytocola glycyrrhizae]|uniref:Uncharacterized protein n=1 Tax=Actinophytocola glycyrrhizae TaxID=2044873 RepID=A0ABV9SFU0_9PSEU
MTDQHVPRTALATALNSGADMLERELELGDRDQDLINLMVNATLARLDDPTVSFDDMIGDNFDTLPHEVRGWWSSWT